MGGNLEMMTQEQIPTCMVQDCLNKSVLFSEGSWLCGKCYEKVLKREVLKLK